MGRLYTHVTRPLDVNLGGTPVHDERAADDVKSFQYYVRLEWGSEGLAEIARKHGLGEIHYADLETRALLGIWTQTWVHVYGRR